MINRSASFKVLGLLGSSFPSVLLPLQGPVPQLTLITREKKNKKEETRAFSPFPSESVGLLAESKGNSWVWKKRNGRKHHPQNVGKHQGGIKPPEPGWGGSSVIWNRGHTVPPPSHSWVLTTSLTLQSTFLGLHFPHGHQVEPWKGFSQSMVWVRHMFGMTVAEPHGICLFS